MAIYLKFGNIKGTATAEGFTGQIALNTFRSPSRVKSPWKPATLPTVSTPNPA